MENDIILVGNGPSLLDNPNGDFIDSHRIIVRFNNYDVTKFPECSGKKTAYWFNTINFVNKHKSSQMNDSHERIYLHSWAWGEDKLYQDMRNYWDDPAKPYYKVTKYDLSEMTDFNHPHTYSHFSTGAIATWLLLKEHTKMNLIGFDWWQNRNKHHYHDNGALGNIHEPQIEKDFFSKLGDSVNFIS